LLRCKESSDVEKLPVAALASTLTIRKVKRKKMNANFCMTIMFLKDWGVYFKYICNFGLNFAAWETCVLYDLAD